MKHHYKLSEEQFAGGRYNYMCRQCGKFLLQVEWAADVHMPDTCGTLATTPRSSFGARARRVRTIVADVERLHSPVSSNTCSNAWMQIYNCYSDETTTVGIQAAFGTVRLISFDHISENRNISISERYSIQFSSWKDPWSIACSSTIARWGCDHFV